jgi:hypothetical protein
MLMVLDKIRQSKKLISQLVLVALLIWFITPEANSLTQKVVGKTYKPNVEQVQLPFSLTKQSTTNSLSKNVDSIISHDVISFSLHPSTNLIQSFLHINSFVRNVFYVYISINAP